VSCDDDILARLDSRGYGVCPQRHEALYCGLQGLSDRQILWFVVGIPPVTAWEAWVIFATFQLCDKVERSASQLLLDSVFMSVADSSQSKMCCWSVLDHALRLYPGCYACAELGYLSTRKKSGM